MTDRERTNLEAARAFVRAVESGYTEGMAACYHPDAIQIEFPNAIAPNGARRDLAALRDASEKGRHLLQSQHFEIHSEMSQGERVVLEATWTGTLTNGQTMRAHYAQFFDFQDGLIIAQRNYDCFEPAS